MRVFPVPLVDAGFRNYRRAQGVVAMGMEGADSIRVDWEVAARELRCGCAREGGHKHALRTVPIHCAPDLAAEVGRFAGPQLRGAEDAEFPRFLGPRLLLRDLLDAVGVFERITHRASRDSDRPSGSSVLRGEYSAGSN